VCMLGFLPRHVNGLSGRLRWPPEGQTGCANKESVRVFYSGLNLWKED
jgi:hypothetical protein